MIAQKLLGEIRSGKIKTAEELELRKIRLANGSPLIKNSEIAALLSPDDIDYDRVRDLLKIKNVRTASGVANVAVMWCYKDHKNSCPGRCIYCPQGQKDASGVVRFITPKSYTGIEPTTLRAIRNNYDPFLQVTNRIKQLNLIGHPTDKCELIVMGGTFMSAPTKFQDEFVKRCLDGFNGSESSGLLSAQLANESASNRCVGLTIETRADFCTQQQIAQMLKLGCTRVEMGVQTTDDELLKLTNRGHSTDANIEAIARLKRNGLKVCVHWMPGLTGLYGKIDEKKEIEMFRILEENPEYRPDELKIYPTLVVPGTKLYELWLQGKYMPLNNDQMIRLLIEFKKIVPPYVRIKRVMRDISEHKPEAGAKTTNLRQLAKIEMKKLGLRCKCIRCREVGHVTDATGNPKLCRMDYAASGGKEIFLSYESCSALLAFLRLRLDSSDAAKVRELHVYGSMVPIGKPEKEKDAPCASYSFWQHKGLGRQLMAETEKIATENGKTKIRVTSGIGVRDYYKRLGYSFIAPYMVKKI